MSTDIAVLAPGENWLTEERSSLENPATPLSYPAEWLLDIFNGGRTDSGLRVSEMTAFQTSTFLACVDLIAGSISSLPMHVYERKQSKTNRPEHLVSYDHAYHDLIHMEPNVEMTTKTLIKTLMCHCLAWGNLYGELQRDEGNDVVAIWPRNPSKTRPRRLLHATRIEAEPWRPFPVNLPAGTMVFETTDGMDMESDMAGLQPARIIPAEDMLHVPGMALDGRVGQSVVWLARQTIGLALALEKYGAKYFGNNARPGGVLTMPTNVKPEDKETAKRSWMEAHGGENQGRIAVLGPGWGFEPIANDPEKSQTIEARKYTRSEICAIFHVPPHMVGDVDKGRANTEQLAQEYIQYTLSPWLVGIKQEWKRKLFPHTGVGRTPRNNFMVDFDLSDMMRAESAAREKFYATGKQWGFLNSNDCRAMEKLNPIEDETVGESYWMPVNMTLAEKPIDFTTPDGSGNSNPGAAAPPSKAEPKKQRALFSAYSRIFRDALGRILARNNPDIHAFKRCFGPILFAVRDLAAIDACLELRVQATVGQETDRYIGQYLVGMMKRSAEWTTDSAEAVCEHELDRALRAVRVAVYREIATEKARGERPVAQHQDDSLSA
jgi:HK97 family phage portal protein